MIWNVSTGILTRHAPFRNVVSIESSECVAGFILITKMFLFYFYFMLLLNVLTLKFQLNVEEI